MVQKILAFLVRFILTFTAVVWNVQTARLAKEHGNCNMIAIGQRMLSEEEAVAILDAWLAAEFKGGGRHRIRIDKIDE